VYGRRSGAGGVVDILSRIEKFTLRHEASYPNFDGRIETEYCQLAHI